MRRKERYVWHGELTPHSAGSSRPVGELVQAVLTSDDEEEREQLVRALQENPDPHEVFSAAKLLAFSRTSEERSLGAQLLGFLGFPDRPLIRKSADVLMHMIRNETDKDVLYHIVDALRHLEDFRTTGNVDIPGVPVAVDNYPGIIPHILPTAHHPDADVRAAVALALGAAMLNMPGHKDRSAIQALVELSADEDRDVRDWATFELAAETLARAELPEVTQALWKRIDDEDAEVRAEALLGLARRHTEEVLEPLTRELLWQLAQENMVDYTLEAACELADPRLCSALSRLKDKCHSEWLQRALDACGCEAPSDS